MKIISECSFLPSPVLREITSSSGLMKTALCFPAKHVKVQWTDFSTYIFQACGPSILHLLRNNLLAEHV